MVLSTQSEIVETKNQMLSGRQDGLVTQAAVLVSELIFNLKPMVIDGHPCREPKHTQ